MFIKNVNNTTKVINIVEIQELYKFERRIKMSEDVNNNPNNIEEGEELDNIIVLNDGEIVGCGTHEELLKTCPIYKEIKVSQLGGEE